ncbi:MAG: hypothetical protein E8D43_11200 [Nitrospira sp.]|nr:MAG: hypothetical protein E8D43_11200 [Nitrospira sp.]
MPQQKFLSWAWNLTRPIPSEVGIFGSVIPEKKRQYVVAAAMIDHDIGLEKTMSKHIAGERLGAGSVVQSRIDYLNRLLRNRLEFSLEAGHPRIRRVLHERPHEGRRSPQHQNSNGVRWFFDSEFSIPIAKRIGLLIPVRRQIGQMRVEQVGMGRE